MSDIERTIALADFLAEDLRAGDPVDAAGWRDVAERALATVENADVVVTKGMIERAATAIREVSAGGVPFGKTRRSKSATKVTVSCSLLAEVALDAALGVRRSA